MPVVKMKMCAVQLKCIYVYLVFLIVSEWHCMGSR